MMSRKILMGVMAVLLLLVCQGPGFAAPAKNLCLTCHTNDKMLKMLYKPPTLESREAEG
jgi:hypothetical protein